MNGDSQMSRSPALILIPGEARVTRLPNLSAQALAALQRKHKETAQLSPTFREVHEGQVSFVRSPTIQNKQCP